MKILTAVIILLGIIYMNEGCASRKRPQPQPTQSPTTAEPTTRNNRITRAECRQSFSGRCLPRSRCNRLNGNIVGRCRGRAVCCIGIVREIMTTTTTAQPQNTTTKEIEATQVTTERNTITQATTQTPVIITERTTTEAAGVITVERTEETDAPNVISTIETPTEMPTEAEGTFGTRPPTLFPQKRLGIKNIVFTETCTGDANGVCKETCGSNEYLKGRFDCQGPTKGFTKNCCVPKS